MKETVSGCFFLNIVYITTRLWYVIALFSFICVAVVNFYSAKLTTNMYGRSRALWVTLPSHRARDHLAPQIQMSVGAAL